MRFGVCLRARGDEFPLCTSSLQAEPCRLDAIQGEVGRYTKYEKKEQKRTRLLVTAQHRVVGNSAASAGTRPRTPQTASPW